MAGKEEIFGAVGQSNSNPANANRSAKADGACIGCVFKFKDEAEAIKIANDTPYGLAASVHSLDARLLRRVVRKLKAVSALSVSLLLWQFSSLAVK